ncbi:MAG: DEAD/DEAH box helicase [Bacteroidota bacterium]
MPASIFDTLKRSTGQQTPVSRAPEVQFRLCYDGRGAYLLVTDLDGEPQTGLDPRAYHGAAHDVLKLVAAFEEENLFSIGWGDEAGDRLYMADNEMLLWPLRRCAQFVDAKGRPLTFAEGMAELRLEVEPDAAPESSGEADPEPVEDKAQGEPAAEAETQAPTSDEAPAPTPPLPERLKATVTLHHPSRTVRRPKPVTERYWLARGVLYETAPVGPSAALVPGFSTVLDRTALPRLLVLLLSYTQNIGIRYGDYRMREGSAVEARPTLFIEQVDASKALFLRLSSSAPGYPPGWFAEYDLSTVVEVDDEARTIRHRPLTYVPLDDAEERLSRQLKAARRTLNEDAGFFREGDLFVIERALAQTFLQKHLPDLLRDFILYGAEKLKAYNVRTASPKLNLRLDHGIDFLAGDATLQVETDTFNLFDALQQFRRDGYLQLSDGTRAVVDAGYFDRLNRIFSKKDEQAVISFFDLPLVEELIDEKVAAALPPVRSVFRGFNTIHEGDVPAPRVDATLRPYQVYGYRWLRYLHEHTLGGCLADDMGLGKTLQTIALLSAVYAEAEEALPPSVVVMPRSLLFNWGRELDKFAPHLTYAVYHGPDRDLDAALQAQVVLTTYDIVRADVEALREVPFCYAVLDEAQRIKNIATQTSKAVMLLDAPHRLALSGTPIENHLGELYALFRFLNPAMFGSVKQFGSRYAQPIQKDGRADVAHELRRKIYPFVLRRLKRDVAKDLPERIDQTLYIDMSEAQARHYEQQRRFYRDAVHERVLADGVKRSQLYIFQALAELRMIASIPEAQTEGRVASPKRALLVEQLSELAQSGRKALVFANYLAALDGLSEDLTTAEVGHVTMTGRTKNRQQVVERFQDDPDCSVFLMTLKTGSLGLNLTAADTVFLFDPWWNQAAEQQAIDRTHRIGQDKTVFSYRLIVRGTIEEKMLLLQEQKRALFDQIIAADSSALKQLSEDDLDFIFA